MKIQMFSASLIPRFVFALSCVLIIDACKHEESDASADPVTVLSPTTLHVAADALSNLKFASANNADFPDTLSVMGKVSPTEDRTFVVPARAAGRIETVNIASGESVTPGQVLGSLFSPDYIAAREEYLQSIRQEKKVSGNASSSSDFSTLAKLSERKLESLGLSKTDVEKLNAVAANDGGAVEPNLTVRAPRAGAVIVKSAIVGNQVNQGDPLFMIADLKEVWFLGDLYPEDLPKVKKDQEVVLEDGPGHTLHGKVSFISPVIDPATRTVKIRALIKNPDLSLRADQYLQGGLVMSHKQALMIPAKAILRDQDENFVFRVKGSRTTEGHASGIDAERVPVGVAGDRAGETAVISGLNPGDEVVADGGLLLNAALENAASPQNAAKDNEIAK